MRTATTIELSRDSQQVLTFVREAEALGLDICWVAEAWGSDAPSVLGYLAAHTERILLGSGIIQIGTRTPVAIAQAALTLAELSQGRFLLGLGASGPQVMEGLHGVAFARALTRMRETITVIRQAWAGEKISFQGETLRIPLDDNSKPMRLSMPANTDIPLYIASMSPKMLELTGQLADGWLGTSFVPEGSAAYFDHLDAGLESAGRTRADIDVCQGAEIALFDDEEAVSRHVAGRKLELAFSIGGMGSAKTNFYNAAYARQGWSEVTREIQARWQSGDREGATGLVTDDMVLATTLIGTPAMVGRRLRAWRDVGVDTVRLYPAGDSLDAKLTNLARALDLIAALDPPGSGDTGR
ncbi:LLM class flavin-dependent oxidoreductase [Nocardia yunnanensis]|uniref:LLM class flavin-dependent oxidoreductase n=1 Tax=Nocardia yunnanensis TaxID=2382165 RepID=A0A386ZGR9_9NOCA|nr:LLM class flavin-dependent oxidoreductase [Nocardia yunnanensis]AYF76697.1 LLM class flavin-dependent oxidoreductase [Nocardia yunnanensis]